MKNPVLIIKQEGRIPFTKRPTGPLSLEMLEFCEFRKSSVKPIAFVGRIDRVHASQRRSSAND